MSFMLNSQDGQQSQHKFLLVSGGCLMRYSQEPFDCLYGSVTCVSMVVFPRLQGSRSPEASSGS